MPCAPPTRRHGEVSPRSRVYDGARESATLAWITDFTRAPAVVPGAHGGGCTTGARGSARVSSCFVRLRGEPDRPRSRVVPNKDRPVPGGACNRWLGTHPPLCPTKATPSPCPQEYCLRCLVDSSSVVLSTLRPSLCITIDLLHRVRGTRRRTRLRGRARVREATAPTRERNRRILRMAFSSGGRRRSPRAWRARDSSSTWCPSKAARSLPLVCTGIPRGRIKCHPGVSDAARQACLPKPRMLMVLR